MLPDGTVKLWDKAGYCLATIEKGRALGHISFDATGTCLITGTGPINLTLSSRRIQNPTPHLHPETNIVLIYTADMELATLVYGLHIKDEIYLVTTVLPSFLVGCICQRYDYRAWMLLRTSLGSIVLNRDESVER